MSLVLGSRIGAYEVLAPLGAGGMGEVFRARDTRLERIVALKVLPQAFAADVERLARFEREAKLLASLNHPNVATLYGLEDPGGAPCLVLEFIEGESLAQRLARGPIPVRETLEIGAAIAAGVEAAHGRGIVHRDLKPGNVMLAAAGAVKVLDFGLAKAPAAESGVELSASPTVAIGATGAGTILGTAAYMSPEQARGRATDARTDVWALGCILFECLSGRAAFGGDSASDVIARVLERDPDWARLPAMAPPRFQALVRRCLAKDATARPATIGEVGRELAAIAAEISLPPSSVARAATVSAPAPSVAVLYFENLARDPDSDYFCAGITEDILTDLSKIRGLRVASRNAVARYRGTGPEIAKVGAELGVGAVVEGTVRRAGDRVRISAQLVSTADGFQLWAERFDRTMEDVFAVQEEIASAIAAALRVALSPDEKEDLGRNRPQDVRAYDLYLKGREQYGHYTRESLEQAMSLFEEATRVDPRYALAWAGVADVHGQRIQWGFTTDAEGTKQLGLEAVEKALALDPRVAEAWKARALLLHNTGDNAGSQSALSHALEINPRFVPALINYGVGLVETGDIAGAERIHRRALEIDPQEPFGTTWVAWLASLTGRPEEAVQMMPGLRALHDDAFYVSIVHAFRILLLIGRQEWAAAEDAIREGLADGATRAHLLPLEALIAARTGRLDEARAMVVECVATPQIGAGSLLAAATAALEVGDRKSARQILLRPVLRSMIQTIVRLDPTLHPVLDEEPFAPARCGLTLVWPLEAPMPPRAVHAVFQSVRIESGRPEGSIIPFGG
jgi:serine/threonine protein kinase/Tfp pilus assembly protein PilF